MSKPIDPRWLGERLRSIRQQKTKTLQDVATETRISIPTLSRIERGESKTIKSDTLLTLMSWLGTDINEIQASHGKAERKSTPDLVALHLRADKNLDAKTAIYLEDMFRSVYEKMAK